MTPPSHPLPDTYFDPAYPSDDTWDMPSPHDEQAVVEALCWSWGAAYEIGADDGQWWFRRRDGKGATETAAGPDALLTMIITDHSAYPIRVSQPVTT